MKKTAALLSFVPLLTAFVLYRAGVFDKYLQPTYHSYQTSPNGGPMHNNSTDTLAPQNKDSVVKKPVMWSGSKSGKVIMPEDFSRVPVSNIRITDSLIIRYDSLIKRADTIRIPMTKSPVIMGSSKSAPVFNQRENELIRLIKMYRTDTLGLQRALEKYFKRKN